MFISHFLCSIPQVLKLQKSPCFCLDFSDGIPLAKSTAPSIEIELWGRVSLWETVLMSYSEKSPGYLAQMQNWPSVWPKNSWGAGDGQPATNFFVPSLRYFGLWLRGDQRVQLQRHILLLIKVQAKNMNNKVHIKSEEFQKGFSQIFERELYWKEELGNVIARWSFDPILII